MFSSDQNGSSGGFADLQVMSHLRTATRSADVETRSPRLGPTSSAPVSFHIGDELPLPHPQHYRERRERSSSRDSRTRSRIDGSVAAEGDMGPYRSTEPFGTGTALDTDKRRAVSFDDHVDKTAQIVGRNESGNDLVFQFSATWIKPRSPKQKLLCKIKAHMEVRRLSHGSEVPGCKRTIVIKHTY